ncbi:MAG: DedA family protein [Dehalococcoidia bacterium]|nr:MAG: DedA family protein [Dehalococcoidia bacterium]
MAIESACIPLPSEIIMPLAGWFLVDDRGLGAEWLLLAAFCGALGNLIGSWVAYAVGAWGGRPLLLRYGRYLLITRHEVEQAERWFARYGDRAVFISRVLPVIRTFISLPAGIARMNLWRFSILTFIGSFPWSLGLAWAGFILGENWERIRDWMRPADIPILIVLAALVAWYIYRRVRTVLREAEPQVTGSEE